MEKQLDLIITLGGDGTMLWVSLIYSFYASSVLNRIKIIT